MESLVIGNLGLKMQIDILKDIVVQLREVKGNPDMMGDIEKAFRDYNHTNI
jgi:hypothetical protein